MRHLALVFSLFCVCSTFSRAHTDRSTRAGHTEHGHRREISFEARVDYLTGENPRGLATADFNGDGVLDIATVTRISTSEATSDDSVSILLGTGDGRFRRAPDVFLGSTLFTVGIVAADLDHDARVDLAVLSQIGSRVLIVSGQGDGTFGPIETMPVGGQNPVALTSGDFNGDRRDDLAVLNQPFSDPSVPPGAPAPGNIRLFIARQGGAFDSYTVPVGLSPDAMAVGDFNQDGHSDLAVLNSSNVSILLDGHFQATSALPVSNPWRIAAGDLNGDGQLDLAIVDGRTDATASVLIGGGDGTFELGQSLPVTSEPRPQSPDGFATAVEIGNFNGDRWPDVAVTRSVSGTVTLLVGAGNGALQAGPALGVTSSPRAIALGDFDADGRLDLATGGGGAVSIVIARRAGFHLAPAYPVGCCPSSLVTGDFNEDGRFDLVASNFVDSSVTTLLGAGRGRFVPAASSSVQRNPSRIASADFDRDGHLDLAMSNPGLGGGGNTVSIALGLGDGMFRPGEVMTVGSIPEAIVAADFNEDRIPDLAVANHSSFNVSILLGVGDATFVRGVTIGVGRNPLDMALTDANGDNHVDLIVANTNQNNTNEPGSVSVLLGRGNGGFDAMPPVMVGVRPISLATADFNEDRIPDVVVLHQSGGPALSLLLGRGDGTFAAGPDLAGTGDYLTAGDFDADGRVDLAILSGANSVAVLLGNGDGTFDTGTGTVAGTGNGPRSFIAGDFDQDGLLDVATGDYVAGTVSVLINTSRPDRKRPGAAARR
jgi:hypothetical protein